MNNNWAEIKKAQRGPIRPFRMWLRGVAFGAITLAIMSVLTYLAWRAY